MNGKKWDSTTHTWIYQDSLQVTAKKVTQLLAESGVTVGELPTIFSLVQKKIAATPVAAELVPGESRSGIEK